MKQGLASVGIILSVTACLWGGPSTLPALIASRKELPAYINARRDHPALPAGEEQAGHYYQTYRDEHNVWQVKLLPYKPLPGDLLLFDDHNKVVTFFYELVGSGAPLHAAMIVERRDHTPALLEAGPNFIPHVYLLEPLPRMRAYPGTVMIRRPRQPLSGDKSAELTRFALAQEGKDYALARLLLQGTPFRCRVGLRKQCFAHTCLERKRWTCSELTAAAGVAAGLLDRRRFPANAMYPRDFCYDDHYDLSASYGEPLLWTEHALPGKLVPDERGNLRLVREESALH